MAEIHSDGFESEDASAWTGTDIASNGVQTFPAVPHHGTYSMLSSVTTDGGSRALVYQTFGVEPEVYCRYYIKFAVLPTADVGDTDYITPRIRTAATTIFNGRIQIAAGGQFKWGFYTSVGAYYGAAATINIGQWYCVESHVLINGASSQADMWVDGVLQVSSGAINLGTTDLVYCSVGYWHDGGHIGASAYYDCVVIADSRIACEAAGQQLFTLINQEDY